MTLECPSEIEKQYVSVFLYWGPSNYLYGDLEDDLCYQFEDLTTEDVLIGPSCTFSGSRHDTYLALDNYHEYALTITHNDTGYPVCVEHEPTDYTPQTFLIWLNGGPCADTD